MSTLKEVGQKALYDKSFFDTLVAHRESLEPTLEKYGLSLSRRELERLAAALTEPARPGDFNLVEFIGRIHKLPPGQNPFIGWDPDWDLAWFPLHRPH
jgi:hypothetical protein